MIALFTDFGSRGPYVGQMRAAVLRDAPGEPLVDLLHDAPAFNVQASAYLLASLIDTFPPHTVFVCVVDPGVGSAARRPVMLQAGGHWFVGPDNGLLSIVARRQTGPVEWREILWRPPQLSASFHGRDLFAPVAARLARGNAPNSRVPHSQPLSEPVLPDWPADLAEIIYIDDFGNAMTGLRATQLQIDTRLHLTGAQATVDLPRARTFSDVPAGQAFWYENANGLVEIALNQGHAAEMLGLRVGLPVDIL